MACCAALLVLQAALRFDSLLGCCCGIPSLVVPGIEGQRRTRALQRRIELTIEEVPGASGDMTLDGANTLLVGFERAHGIGRLSQQCSRPSAAGSMALTSSRSAAASRG